VLHKFGLDSRLRELLLSTGDRVIIEHTDRDSYWGDGGAHSWRPGQPGNKLGQILYEVSELCKS
jgi:predicted NAD-dependent protein-ADP-ribosyltransferase YbiA (DUF1768 family)